MLAIHRCGRPATERVREPEDWPKPRELRLCYLCATSAVRRWPMTRWRWSHVVRAA